MRFDDKHSIMRDHYKKPRTHIFDPLVSSTCLTDLNDDCLIAIFRYCGVLNLHTLSQVSPRFATIIKSFRSNSTLHIQVCSDSYDSNMRMFENVGNHIQTLFINFSGMRQDKSLRMMTTIQEHCSATLMNLCVKKWFNMRPDKIRSLLSGLRTIHLEGCDGNARKSDKDFVNGNIAQVLAEQRQLEVLSLIDCEEFMRDGDMAMVMEDKPKLRRLQIMLMTDQGFTGLPKALSQLPNLQYLTLHMDSTKYIELTPLAEIETLRSLHLAYYNEDDFHDIKEMLRRTLDDFKDQSHLAELVLHGCRLNDAGYIAIGQIKSIRHLALRKHYWANDRTCDLILGNTKYRTIDMFDCIGITDEGVSHLITMCPELEMVDVSWCTQLSTTLIPRCYKIITNRPRTEYTFEMLLGGSISKEFRLAALIPEDQNLMRVVHDPCPNVYYKPSRTMKSILDEIEHEKLLSKNVRLPTNAQNVCRKEFMCDNCQHNKCNRMM